LWATYEIKEIDVNVLPKCEPIILTKEQLEEEKKRAMKGENLGWPYSPAIQIIPKKRKKK